MIIAYVFNCNVICEVKMGFVKFSKSHETDLYMAIWDM